MVSQRDVVLRKVRAVIFDVGETLIDESRLWKGWAIYLGVTEVEFRQVLDQVIARREHHRKVLYHFDPNLDVAAARQTRQTRQARQQRELEGAGDLFDVADLYPDALDCLNHLQSLNLRVGIAGNQPIGAERALKEAGCEVDFVASSERWGVSKPDLRFFSRIVEECGCEATSIAYVGDRLDNDILPAREAGMTTIFIERGPWGRVHAKSPDISLADLHVRTLKEISELFSHARDRLN
ncbi:MAG: HAD family hydrolase [Pseudomonadota bacterium]